MSTIRVGSKELNPSAFYGAGWDGLIIRLLDYVRRKVERALVRRMAMLYGDALFDQKKASQVLTEAVVVSPTEAAEARPKPIEEVNFGEYVARSTPDRSLRGHYRARRGLTLQEVSDE